MFDVIIIGGGPAGATAALYTARAALKTLVIHRDFGALNKAERVDNFYGHLEVNGKSLVETGLEQVRRVGAEIVTDEVVGLKAGGPENGIIVETAADTYECKAAVLATGASRSAPKIPGLSALEGRGVSYCAICDGFFYRGKDVAVLGSGTYALHEVRDLLPIAASVTLLTNGDEPTADFPENVIIRKEKLREIISGVPTHSANSLKVKLLDTKPAESLQGVALDTGEELPLSGLFIAIGIAGGTELARKIGALLDPDGSIVVDRKMRTSVPGLWAAGDCTQGLRQIAKAVGEGAIAGADVVKGRRPVSAPPCG